MCCGLYYSNLERIKIRRKLWAWNVKQSEIPPMRGCSNGVLEKWNDREMDLCDWGKNPCSKSLTEQ